MDKRYFMFNTNNNQWYTFTDSDRKDRQLFKDSKGIFYKNKGVHYLSVGEAKELEEGMKQFFNSAKEN